MKRLGVVIAAVTFLVVGGAFMWRAAGSNEPSTASVVEELGNPALQAELMISLTPPSGASAPTITLERAVAVAADELGRSDPPAIAIRGSGQAIATKPYTSAWIVVYAGGDPPPYNPSEVGLVVDFVGVLVGDQSGEILRTFGKGHQE